MTSATRVSAMKTNTGTPCASPSAAPGLRACVMRKKPSSAAIGAQ